MNLFFSLIGMMLVLAFCRRPGVPVFSLITWFNRKSKLTAVGEKLYGVAAVVIVIGMLAVFAGPADEKEAKQALDSRSDAVTAAASSPADEAALQLGRFGVLSRQFATSAEGLASLIPTNGFAESRLELCNSFVEGGMMDWKADHDLHRLSIAVRDCHNEVLKLCRDGQPDDAAACSAYKSRTAGMEY